MTNEQIERYSRNILLREIGGKGQKKLLSSRVLIIGAGGLGSPVALYLAAAGVGIIGIADSDVVDLSNLQRQVIHTTADIGRPKVESARKTMLAINPDIQIDTYQHWVCAANIGELIAGYDFIIDAADNFATKYLINDACVLAGKPFSHGGILQFIGQTFTILPGRSACYRCLFPDPPPQDAIPTCSQAGVLGMLPGVIGGIQATEAIKYLLGIGTLLTNRIMTYSATDMEFRAVEFRKKAQCPICGATPAITLLQDEPGGAPACDLKQA